MVLKKILLCMLVCLGVYQVPVLAADNSPTAIAKTSIQYLTSPISQTDYQKLTPDQQQAIAGMWNLTTADYDHYLGLMNNTVNGIYYQGKHLDPSTILGFNATTDEDRKKYALIAIKNEQARVAKELAFQNTFYQLQRELFPHQKPIADHKQENNKIILQPDDTLLYFVDVASPIRDNTLRSLLKVIDQHSSVKLAIYIAGQATTDDAIRQWAAQEAISPALVKSNQISLNHDNGHLQKLTTHPATLPQLFLLRNHQVQPINVAALQ